MGFFNQNVFPPPNWWWARYLGFFPPPGEFHATVPQWCTWIFMWSWLGLELVSWYGKAVGFSSEMTWPIGWKKQSLVFSHFFFLPVKSHQRGKKWKSNLCTIFSWKVTWTLYLLVMRIWLSHIHPCLVAKSFRFSYFYHLPLSASFLVSIHILVARRHEHGILTKLGFAMFSQRCETCFFFAFILISGKPD